MKRLMLLALLLTSQLSFADDYPNILGIGGDKYLHFGVSAGLVGVGYLFMSMPSRLANVREGRIPALIGATAFAFSIGLAKEVMDAGEMPKGQQYLDGGDLAADALGCVSAAVIIYFWDIHGRKDPAVPQVGFNGRSVTVGWKF